MRASGMAIGQLQSCGLSISIPPFQSPFKPTGQRSHSISNWHMADAPEFSTPPSVLPAPCSCRHNKVHFMCVPVHPCDHDHFPDHMTLWHSQMMCMPECRHSLGHGASSKIELPKDQILERRQAALEKQQAAEQVVRKTQHEELKLHERSAPPHVSG